MMTEIGAFEAKTQFSRLLARARAGEAFTITHRGAAIAKLVPIGEPDERASREAFARLRRRAGAHKGEPINASDILSWCDEGRR
jgi:prevent-host-death family protein